ncbi:MAG: tRNA preQ1(34) S-adenosylmethionine ribosyltransferase-isomerase QueA [Thermoplasmata archaeon]
MRVEDFDYSLPRELIAQRPTDGRAESRLMVLSRVSVKHDRFANFLNYLSKGDLLVLNDTKVIPARLKGRRVTGGKVELLLLRKEGDNWICLGKGRFKAGERISVGDSSARILEKSDGRLLVSFDTSNFKAFLKKYGEMPVPPYIKEKLNDEERYQTVYASVEGSVASPTAGLHLTHEMLEELYSRGIGTAKITLHVGPGTFLPVRAERIEDHTMEEEYFEISVEAAERINRTLESSNRLFVVGTTTVRALESGQRRGRVVPSRGWTDLFIYPPYEFNIRMDALLTNLHLPRSTILMLVSSYAGRERILEAYKEAIERKYRFYSFGDAMLIFR